MAKLVQIHPSQYRLTAKIQLAPKAESLNQQVIQASYLAFGLYGRYWIRTSDPFRVKEVRYHCANRPSVNLKSAERDRVSDTGDRLSHTGDRSTVKRKATLRLKWLSPIAPLV